MSLGTVTRVEGDRLVAFGHPMMNAGATSLPTAVARVRMSAVARLQHVHRVRRQLAQPLRFGALAALSGRDQRMIYRRHPPA